VAEVCARLREGGEAGAEAARWVLRGLEAGWLAQCVAGGRGPWRARWADLACAAAAAGAVGAGGGGGGAAGLLELVWAPPLRSVWEGGNEELRRVVLELAKLAPEPSLAAAVGVDVRELRAGGAGG
jgi:hypothetical protein